MRIKTNARYIDFGSGLSTKERFKIVRDIVQKNAHLLETGEHEVAVKNILTTTIPLVDINGQGVTT